MNFPCLKQHEDGVLLNLNVQPRSSKNQLVGLLDDALKIKLMSPPVDGAANKCCCAYLAKLFGIARGRVTLVSGEKSRRKVILLRGLELCLVENVLETHLDRS
ncbi:MAG TPA: DUF167 domain-containing protein [Geopsychrobacteraceae bacterium]